MAFTHSALWRACLGLVFAYLTISFLGRFFVVSQFDGSFFSKVSNTGQTPFACH
jgi:hypothetical protein